MKNQPFVVGDTAYHPGLGKVQIMSIERDGLDIQVMEQAGYNVPQWTYAGLLSFEPWPAPVHERPLQDGYYLVAFKDYKRVYLAQYIGAADFPWALIGPNKKLVDDHTYAAANDGKVKPLSYLGTELKWWQG